MNEHERLAREVGDVLAARGLMCATAESCTGGLVAATITDIAGSSEWFDRGFVTYTNAAKEAMLGVPAATLAAFGAVSEPVARAMAEGALRHSRAAVAVAITGVAGPGGGSPAKPVGTVCFAWAVRDRPTQVATRHFPGDRRAVRWASVAAALAGLIVAARDA
ncbi:MAG: CinA family protein [Burkholderiales bacterium]|nr:CinA family protein [Burkholderiales bacterium]